MALIANNDLKLCLRLSSSGGDPARKILVTIGSGSATVCGSKLFRSSGQNNVITDIHFIDTSTFQMKVKKKKFFHYRLSRFNSIFGYLKSNSAVKVTVKSKEENS